MARIAILGSEPDALVAAIELARSGREVHVFEPSEQIGGAAWSAQAFHAGCTTHGYHHDVLVAPDTMKRLGLFANGLTLQPRGRATSWRDGEQVLPSEAERTASEARDARLAAYTVTLAQVGRQAAPRLLGDRDWVNLAKTGLSVRLLGTQPMSELLRRAPLAIRDELNEDVLGADCAAGEALAALEGTWLGPYDPTTAGLAYLRHALRDACVASGVALCGALAARAAAAGVTVHVGQPIEGIDIGSDGADGVRVGGTRYATEAILHGAAPQALLRLIDPLQRPPSLSRDLEHLRARGTVAVVHLASSGALLPSSEAGTHARLATHMDAMERAHDAKKRGMLPEEPALVLRQWGAQPDSGIHTTTAYVHGIPHDFEDAQAVEEWVKQALDQHFGGACPEAMHVVLPRQMARDDRMHGSHLYHAEVALDQLWSLRPAQSLAGAGTRIPRLYHASLASHPGPLAVGSAGEQAAQTMVSDLS